MVTMKRSTRSYYIPSFLCLFSTFMSVSSFLDSDIISRVDRHCWMKVSMTKYDQEESNTTTKKRIVFIRHGQTFMNEFIDGINYGGPNFTDIFPDTPEYRKKYYDSPLSPTGINQAQELHNKLKNLMNGKEDAAQQLSISPEDASILQSLELILVSPLTRALQTLDIGLFKTLSNEIPIRI